MRIATDSRRLTVWTCLVALGILATIGLRALAQAPGPQLVLVEDGGYILGDDLRAKLSSLGVEVLESYGYFALVSVSEEQRELLREASLRVSDLPERTRVGRGAFLFDTLYGEPTIPESLRKDPSVEPSYDTYIVQFVGPLKQAWVEALKLAPAEVFDYLHSSSVIG